MYRSCPFLVSSSTSSNVFGGFISSPAGASEKQGTYIWVLNFKQYPFREDANNVEVRCFHQTRKAV